MKVLVAVLAVLTTGWIAASGCYAVEEQKMIKNKICPISGEEVGSMGEPYHVTFEGKTVSLCCEGCRKAFDKDPAGVVAAAEEQAQVEAETEDHSGHQH